jgi:hypothetical protein
MSFNEAFKSGRIDVSPMENVPKTKGTIRALAASRKLFQPDYREDQSEVLLSNRLQKDKVLNAGIDGDILPENVPNHNAADYEKVFANRNNAVIVIGRDRPGSLSSGYGNMGATGAGAIYLKAGMAFPPKSKGVEEVYAENNFKTDAAGIYISQMTDIDNNYGLVYGSMSLRAKSGVGIKADGVRIIARENIKLVTGPFPKEQNSIGGKNVTYYGVDIIAGNDDSDLQPIPLGNSLKECLDEILGLIGSLGAMIENINREQAKFDNALLTHTHVGPSPSAQLPDALGIKQVNILNNVTTKMPEWKEYLANIRDKYFDSDSSNSIQSKHNRVN